MVNTGRPSRGCDLCRQRKVRCDEGKPSCLKCLRLDKLCQYRDQSSLVFRISSTAPLRHENRRLQPRLTNKLAVGCGTNNKLFKVYPKSDPQTEIDVFATQGLSSGTTQTSGLETTACRRYTPWSEVCGSPNTFTRSIAPGVHERSILLFFGTYVTYPRVTYNSTYTDFLPTLFAKAPRETCLPLALRAAAVATLANHYSPAEFRVQIRHDYSIALQSMNAALENHKERLSDETLFAAWLLGTFEFTTGYSMTAKQPSEAWNSHTDGMLTLMRMRGKSQLYTSRGRQIFMLSYVSIQWRALVFGLELPNDFADLISEIFRLESHGSAASARIFSFLHQVTSLRARTRCLLASAKERSKTDLWKAFLEGSDLLLDAQGWHEDEPGWDTFHFRYDASHEQTLPYRAHARYYYSNALVYIHWSRFHLASVLLLETLIDVLQVLLSENEADVSVKAQIDQNVRLLNEAADEFLGSVAFALGEINEHGEIWRPSSLANPTTKTALPSVDIVGAMRILLYLRALKYCRYLGQTQLEAMDNALSRIYREMKLNWALVD